MSETFVVEPAGDLEPLAWDPNARIYARMVAILSELPAIGKDQRNPQQNFMYRGHDDVLNALNPLLAKHGVFVVPRVVERQVAQRETSGGKVMYEVNLHVEFTFFGADGSSVHGSAWGEGTDMGDKSTNKAMTMAFKNVLAQSFAVSTAESYDTDSGTPEETVRRGSPAAPKPFDPDTDLHPEALRDKAAVASAFTEIDNAVDWVTAMGTLTNALYGTDSWRELSAENQKDFWRRMANALVFVHDAWPGGFPPPTAAEFQDALAKAFKGEIVPITYVESDAALTKEQQEQFQAALDKDDEPEGAG